MRLLQLTWLLPIVLAYTGYVSAELEECYSWKYFDYAWESDDQKQVAIDCGKYNKTTIMPVDLQPLNDGRILVTCPKDFDNPASLSTISDQTSDGGPLLAPYPDWSWHTAEDCSGWTSISRVHLDDFNKLWFIDSGKIGNEQVCSAKLIKFDVDTEEELLRVEIPEELVPNPEIDGRMEVKMVEVSDDSEEVFLVWITDDADSRVVMYDGTDFWSREDEVFKPVVNEWIVNGTEFEMARGIHDLMFLPGCVFNDEYLMVDSLSDRETYIAKRDELVSNSGDSVQYWKANITLPSQESAKAVAQDLKVVVAAFTTQTEIACWNTQKPATWDNIAILAEDSEKLQIVSTIKITKNEEGKEQIYVMSDRAQRMRTNSMDPDETNFRILTDSMESLIAGTVCEGTSEEPPTTLADMNFVEVDECS